MSATVIAFEQRKDTTHPHLSGVGTTCKPHLERHYHTREEAQGYLSSRGFLLLPFGWANGRWRARIEIHESEFVVTVDMPSAALPRPAADTMKRG